MTTSKEVTVLGAGAIGVCVALYLQRDGFTVTLIDRDEPASGCSFGNAGLIQCASVVTVATPGIVRQVPRMLLDKSQPLRQGDAGDASALGLVKQLVLHVHRHLPPRNRFLNRKGRNENIISVTAEVHSCEHRFL